MNPESVDLTHCPDCGEPVTYDRADLGNGLSRFHVRPGDRLEFLCPETPGLGRRPVRSGKRA